MSIKFIPDAWKAKLAGPGSDFNSKVDFYLNPRGRVFPALTSAGISYIKNDATTNRRGTYRMQCGASTLLTYLYTLPQRFIIEGWFKPEFAYNVGASKTLFSNTGASAFDLIYDYTSDKIGMATIPGATISTTAFTSDAELQKWIYVRCFFDNIAKLKGFYCTVDGVVYADSQNTPGAGTFVPLNTISFMPAVAAESSYWIIHELDETLALGQYKTYQADRQIMFDFNGTTLGRERIRIPRSRDLTDMRGVKDYSVQKTGSGKANKATLDLYNLYGQFSDDQYDAFDPFQGYYNGPQKYLQNRVGVEIEIQAPNAVSANDYQGYREHIFIGRTTPGAFTRNSQDRYQSIVSINAEDGISELGETKLSSSHAYNNTSTAYTLAQTADESLSLVHLITRLVTKHEIRNYALNSSFENATIGNSWLASGLTLTRDNTYAQFGTYAGKAVAGSAGQYLLQRIDFETIDFIDVGDVFNFSAYVRQGDASSMYIEMWECSSAGAIGSASVSYAGTDTGVFTKINVSRGILSSSCTRLLVAFVSTKATTFYVDGAMLTRGIDPLDYFLLNSNDGASGVGSAESYATYSYDTKAIDTDVTTLSHPYAIVNKGDTAWDHLKDIGDALIPRYIGETCDGILQFKFAYNETDPATIGAIDNVASIQTSLDVDQANAIKVHGILIDKTKPEQVLWDGSNSLVTNGGGKPMHPITNATYLNIQGATLIEAKYSEEGEAQNTKLNDSIGGQQRRA